MFAKFGCLKYEKKCKHNLKRYGRRVNAVRALCAPREHATTTSYAP